MILLRGAATLATVLMFLTNLVVVKQIKEDGHISVASILPFLSTFANCCFWLKYGVMLGESSICWTNAVGVIITVYALYQCHNHCESERTRAKIEKRILVTVGVVLSVLTAIKLSYGPEILSWVGFLCCALTMVMFGTPLASLRTVIQAKSAHGHLSLPMILISFVSASLWSLIGFRLRDNWIIQPNIVGAALSLVQLLVYSAYRK
ncbi:sugar efflux transporter for intercellular exchange-domain-containing protein [Polychytrium aggregatum]|uniref:sugar efflux transporter for intercellular exchange-domain-containing protein n=1 Tax=Polychytrium aggregatum TaxID=110093 RepID=UPI0022FE9A93|nr:sugar efflux transporter for intercellular exchange-domain-containing protein [Polychytrium aggregatum]KAI9205487.1 sugar efflux transporter for intercellular exchange-domain-containing protein [Polychytrium aggregatum]